MLPKSFVKAIVIRKSDRKTSHTLFQLFWKKLLQSATNREGCMNFKLIIKKCDKNLFQCSDFTKCDNNLLQTMTVITKWNKIYYKVRQVLKKFDEKLLRSSNRIKDLTEQKVPCKYKRKPA